MRISGNSFTESAYQLYQKNKISIQTKTTFNDLRQAASGDVQNAKDPKLQLWADYQAWKSQQPPRQLPDSKGATGENLAYLLENFTGDEKTGELSLYQRMEMIDTMREMGIITEEQMKDCFGIGDRSLRFTDISDPNDFILIAPVDSDVSSWFHFFWGVPLMKACDLDDIFEALDKQLKFTNDYDLANEIKEVLESVRQKIQK